MNVDNIRSIYFGYIRDNSLCMNKLMVNDNTIQISKFVGGIFSYYLGKISIMEIDDRADITIKFLRKHINKNVNKL